MPAPKGNKYHEKRKTSGRKSLYKEEYATQAYKLTLMGATDSELADFFEVTEQTINNWKKEHKDFFESLRAGKVKADSEVAHKLLDRALGATVVSQKAFKVRNSNGQGKGYSESIEIIEVSEELPPDTLAIKMWLTNRQPDKWREKQHVDANLTLNPFEELMRKVSERKNND